AQVRGDLFGGGHFDGALFAAAGNMVFKGAGLGERKGAEGVKQGAVLHFVFGDRMIHSGRSITGLSASRSFIIARRVHVLTVPSGRLRCAAISVWVMPE